MKIGFIGDIVGKPGRLIIKRHLKRLRQEHFIDFMIANYENASHGFGLTEKNCIELLGYDIDLTTGGNHSFDKKEILGLFDTYPLIRPMNYPKETPGDGIYQTTLLGHQTAILNLMGHYTMPMVDNPFTMIVEEVATFPLYLADLGIDGIGAPVFLRRIKVPAEIRVRDQPIRVHVPEKKVAHLWILRLAKAHGWISRQPPVGFDIELGPVVHVLVTGPGHPA